MGRDFFRLAQLVALSYSVRRRKDADAALTSKTEPMVQSVADYDQIRKDLSLTLGRATIERAMRADCVRDNSIDGTVTSPPYANALDYIENEARTRFRPRDWIRVRSSNSSLGCRSDQRPYVFTTRT